MDHDPAPDQDVDPAAVFARVVALRRTAAQQERAGVAAALEQGWTWARIGQALGISGQAAHKKLGPGPGRTRGGRG
ncbi:helix-turn-helix domain-containing protein [Aeromicrobium sp. NPDC092404]|uniref:helix-turn-helix domain-containing protein n=1 Tax=Aeromicrobium sp. NPDC092404 TaxID=3154976 RepID=UPI0034388C02